MAIVDLAVRAEEADPVIIALPEPITEETLIALGAKNPEYRFETTADGRLVVSPLIGTAASLGEGELVRQIANWNAEHRLGFVTSSNGGVTLADGAIKGPDATFISRRRKAAMPSTRKQQRAFTEIAPDAVFELLSPSDNLKYTGVEVRRVHRNGKRCRRTPQPPRSIGNDLSSKPRTNDCARHFHGDDR